jgi:hypothetical protein
MTLQYHAFPIITINLTKVLLIFLSHSHIPPTRDNPNIPFTFPTIPLPKIIVPLTQPDVSCLYRSSEGTWIVQWLTVNLSVRLHSVVTSSGGEKQKLPIRHVSIFRQVTADTVQYLIPNLRKCCHHNYLQQSCSWHFASKHGNMFQGPKEMRQLWLTIYLDIQRCRNKSLGIDKIIKKNLELIHH